MKYMANLIRGVKGISEPHYHVLFHFINTSTPSPQRSLLSVQVRSQHFSYQSSILNKSSPGQTTSHQFPQLNLPKRLSAIEDSSALPHSITLHPSALSPNPVSHSITYLHKPSHTTQSALSNKTHALYKYPPLTKDSQVLMKCSVARHTPS